MLSTCLKLGLGWLVTRLPLLLERLLLRPLAGRWRRRLAEEVERDIGGDSDSFFGRVRVRPVLQIKMVSKERQTLPILGLDRLVCHGSRVLVRRRRHLSWW